MVDFAAFRALRFTGSDLSKEVAPPYDVISGARQDELYAQGEHNIVRVDLNKTESGDSELSRYERAQTILADWLNKSVLKKDDDPAYYLLAQTFTGPDGVERTRTGFFGCAQLSRFGEGPILPHERTLKGPKIDRLRLFRATKTNLSPIFGMYHDAEGEVLSVLESTMVTPPMAVAQMDGVKNRLWRIDEDEKVAAVAKGLSDKKLYIADGHHRYETGLAYREERQKEGAPSGDKGYERILMFIARIEDPGMVVFPTHRLVHSLKSFDENAFVSSLEPYFDTQDISDDPEILAEDLKEAGKDENSFVAVTKNRRVLLRRNNSPAWNDIPSLPMDPTLNHLDVAVLHGVVLEHILDISKEAQATQKNLRYSKQLEEAVSSPQAQADVQIALIMNPTKISEVVDVSEAGEVMPQKSTFFYPKIPSGLVLYPLD